MAPLLCGGYGTVRTYGKMESIIFGGIGVISIPIFMNFEGIDREMIRCGEGLGNNENKGLVMMDVDYR